MVQLRKSQTSTEDLLNQKITALNKRVKELETSKIITVPSYGDPTPGTSVTGQVALVDGVLQYFDGSSWNAVASGGAKTLNVNLYPITTGLVAGNFEIGFNCTITKWTLLADVSGSIVVDIWKDTYANYPPVVGDSITASAKPTLSSAIKNTDSTLSGWTTSITAGDILRFSITSFSTVGAVTLALELT